ncbi:tryptophanyl-tRNA synthetase [Mytilinidion resinicola]|uniref:Tryptophan--tRNA ligase, cytoplasmic n=1 Tax=Mytilinidion resinicola TaxID=574789 RepID=A0A6A6YAK5_9PEZI|nr:tryptophanyl-tRNA synthetase [Mytilinidion resinicola]KAF2805145.1 tryptophanyl-tRNA synthetase [Mytilinidion resinicola]
MAENAPTGLGEPPSVAALSLAETATTPAKHLTEQEINPWDVQAGTDEHGNTLEFDYVAISQKWNTKLLDKATLERFERLTGKKPHRWLRRGLFFSHRDFDLILDYYERGEPFMLYTGRGPSAGSLHVGHSIPFEFTKWLQDVFDVPLVIMLTDDEKFLFKEGLTIEAVKKFSIENAKDAIAMGYDLKKTFIYSDFLFMGSGSNGHFYENAMEFSKLVNFNQMRGAFGFDGSTSSGRVFFPNLQCVAAFASSYPFIWGDDIEADRKATTAAIPCLIPCAIDQDPYFRLVRDNSLRMQRPSPKPALIHSKFLTSLQGAGGKMSASVPMSAIFLDDTPNQIKKKINASFSGGQETLELHRELGGNPDVDVPYQYLCYFEDDDEKLDRFYHAYKKGEMLTGEMKKECITLVQSYVKSFQEARAKVTDEVVKEYMKPRKLEWKGNPNPTKPPKKAEEATEKADADGQKGQGKRAAKRAAKAAEKAAGDASKGA